MNEEVTNKANELLLSMLNGIETASDFVIDQTPDVIQQLLAWHFITSLLCFVFIFASPFIFYFIGGKIVSMMCQEDDDKERIFCVNIGKCVGLLASFLTVVGLFCEAQPLAWLQIWIAPKLYLLEYAASLGRG